MKKLFICILFLSLHADQWITRAPLPTPRYSAIVVECNGKIYVIGGALRMTSFTNVNEEYDPQNDTWTLKTPMSTARAGAGVAPVGDTIYVIGGWTGGTGFSNNEGYVPDIKIPEFVQNRRVQNIRLIPLSHRNFKIISTLFPATFKIYDSSGRLYYILKPKSHELFINFKKSGLYLLLIEKSGEEVKKVKLCVF